MCVLQERELVKWDGGDVEVDSKGVNLEGQTEVAKLAEEAGTSDTDTKGSGEECSLPGGLEAGGAEVVASEPARSPTSQNDLSETIATVTYLACNARDRLGYSSHTLTCDPAL